jgi:hypothetical protein
VYISEDNKRDETILLSWIAGHEGTELPGPAVGFIARRRYAQPDDADKKITTVKQF